MILTLTISQAKAEVINSVLAHVGNKIITFYDVENLDPKQYREILSIKDESYRATQLKGYITSALDYLINQEIITIAAEREGIRVTDEEVDRAVGEILTRNNIDESKLSEFLETEGTSLAKYRFQLKNDILNSRVRSQVLMPKIVVAERDLREAADNNKDEFPFHDKYELSIIIMPTKEQLAKPIKELKSKVPFEEVAKKYSIDRSASQGGMLGFMDADIMPSAMYDVIKDTKIGKISDPFELNGQWAVCRVISFKSKYDFDEETRVKLTEKASETIFAQVFKNWLERNKETIVVLRKGEEPGAAR